MKWHTQILTVVLYVSLSGCSTNPPMKTVDFVDLERFMGDWYVIANIPTFIEKEAHNAIENYQLNPDGSIATTFTFRKGGITGDLKKYTPTGFIRDNESNALWGMQFIWPIKADFRIVYLDKAYSKTIIGRRARDYVWIMARSPEIPKAEFMELVSFVEQLGYDISKLRRVPQQWPPGEETR